MLLREHSITALDFRPVQEKVVLKKMKSTYLTLLCVCLIVLYHKGIWYAAEKTVMLSKQSKLIPRYNFNDIQTSFDRVFPLYSKAESWEKVKFSDYHHIIVSGPQRSGTTVFARTLAQKLNYTWLDESFEDCNLTDKTSGQTFRLKEKDDPFDIPDLKYLGLLRAKEAFVAQRPRWSSVLHLLPGDKRTLIVFMARNCLDVFESQNKIMKPPGDTGWTCKFGRTSEWERYNVSDLKSFVDIYGLICTIKQQAFLRAQMPQMDATGQNYAVVAYNSLQSLIKFIPAWERPLELEPKELAWLS